jgi:AcrR family transcriptional regulator
VHDLPGWDWRDLTVRAVAQRAGVNERTVYRHFSNERELHDAVMRRLEEEAGIDIERLELEDLGEVTRSLYAYLSSFPVRQQRPRDPTFAELDERRRTALREAVDRLTEDWSDDDREMAAAILDMLWCIPSYERLITAWELDGDQAAQAVTWVIDLLEEAIRQGRRPTS